MNDDKFIPRVNINLINDVYKVIESFVNRIYQFNDMIDYYTTTEKDVIKEVLINNMFIEHIIKTGIIGHPNTGYNNQYGSINFVKPTLTIELYQQIKLIHEWNKSFMKSKHFECLLYDIPDELPNLRNMETQECEFLKNLLTKEYISMMINSNDKDMVLVDPLGYISGAYVFENGFVECVTNPIYIRTETPEFKEDFIHIAWYESSKSAQQFYDTADVMPSRGNIQSLSTDEFIFYQNIENKGLSDKIHKMFKVYCKYRKFATMIVQSFIRFDNKALSNFRNAINQMDIPKMNTDNWDSRKF